MATTSRVLIFIACVAMAVAKSHHKVESMYMSRTMGSDSSPSATGYIYRSDSNGPASYVQLGAGAVHQHLNTYPGLQEALPQTFAAYNVAPAVPEVPIVYNPYVPPLHLASNVAALGKPSYPVLSEAAEADDDDESDDESDDEEDEDDFSDDGIGYEINHDGGDYHGDVGHHGHGHSYSNGGGKSFSSSGHSAHGGKGDKGYKSNHHFDKGQEGSYGKAGQEGHYNVGAGHNSKHYDDADKYSKHHSASKGHAGGSFGEKKGHSKGSKTTGFHNVYHKDEFKKEHDFYDDAHNSGHFDKHGSEGSNHHSAKGGHAKGGHHDSTYNQGDSAKHGFHNKGHSYAADQGHNSKAGHDGYYNNHNDYGKKGGHSEGKEYGYAEKH